MKVEQLKQKFYKSLAILAGLMAVFVASFGDEIAAFTFLFSQINNASMKNVSLLMSCTLLGNLCASPLSIVFLHKLKITSTLKFAFLISILLVAISYQYPFSLVFYIAAFILGTTMGVFWSVLSVLIPSCFSKKSLINVNKTVQSIRNLGYVITPFLAGLASSTIGITNTLLVIIFIFMLAIPCSIFFTNQFSSEHFKKNENFSDNGRYIEKIVIIPNIIDFLNLPRIKITLLPLAVTICTTSTFNVAFMYLLLVHLHYSSSLYGIIVSAISLGLVLGPIFFASFVKKIGMEFGACCAAATIGLCVYLTGLIQSTIWLYVILFLLGIANGLQNTLMATLVMEIVPEKERKKMIPIYTFIIQFCVFCGFIITGQVQPQFAQQLLIISGLIACFFGLVGAIGNFIFDRYVI